MTGYGTGGTLNGVSRVLARERPDTRIVVCEPEEAQLLASGLEQPRNADGSPSVGHAAWKPHPMQGWTPDFIPKLTAEPVSAGAIDQLVPIAGPDAIRCSLDLARKEGIFVGISGGATFAGALKVAAAAPKGLDHPGHVTRHRRTLSEHAAVCRRRGRHGRGGNLDLQLHAWFSPGGLKARFSSLPLVGRDRSRSDQSGARQANPTLSRLRNPTLDASHPVPPHKGEGGNLGGLTVPPIQTIPASRPLSRYAGAGRSLET